MNPEEAKKTIEVSDSEGKDGNATDNFESSLFSEETEKLRHALEFIESIDTEKDLNIIEFDRLKANKTWFEAHKGYWVSFIDGKEVYKHKDRNSLLSYIRKEFPNKSRFVTEVEEEEEVIDFPTF